jgi:hypothetical protein
MGATPHCFCKCAQTTAKKRVRTENNVPVCAKCVQATENRRDSVLASRDRLKRYLALRVSVHSAGVSGKIPSGGRVVKWAGRPCEGETTKLHKAP